MSWLTKELDAELKRQIDARAEQLIASLPEKVVGELAKSVASSDAWSVSALQVLKAQQALNDIGVHPVDDKIPSTDIPIIGDIMDNIVSVFTGTYPDKPKRGKVTRVQVCYNCHEPNVYNFTQNKKHKQCYSCYQQELARDAKRMIDAGTDDKVAIAVNVINTVTEFTAYMACPYCDTWDWHWLRIAHHKPAGQGKLYEAYRDWFQWKLQFPRMMQEQYECAMVLSGADTVHMWGSARPIKYIGGEAELVRKALSIKPIGVDGGPTSGYDPEEALCVRECKACEKEWAQK